MSTAPCPPRCAVPRSSSASSATAASPSPTWRATTRSRRSRCTAISRSWHSRGWSSACTAGRARWASTAGVPAIPTAWVQRAGQSREAKAAIAAHAVRYVDAGATIFLDASSTALAVARRLVEDPPNEITLVTNSPAIAYEVQAEALHVIVCPGELDQHMRMLAGRWTVEFLAELNFAVAFVSAAGRDARPGPDDRAPPARRRHQRRARERRAQRRADRRDRSSGARRCCRSRARRSSTRSSPMPGCRPTAARAVPGRRRAARDRQPRGEPMSRPVTLFTGQWADLPLSELAAKCGGVGLRRARARLLGRPLRRRARPSATPATRPGSASCSSSTGSASGRSATTSSARPSATRSTSATRACCRPRSGATATPRACAGAPPSYMKDTARAAAQLGVEVVTGFTGSPIWHLLYSFPPNDWSVVEAGYEEFAERWGPIIDVFESEGVRFALEVHPTEIAYDFVTTRKALDAIGDRDGFGINFDPSHFEHQFLDSAAFIAEFGAEDLPRAHQGLQAAARRPLVDPRRPPRLRPARARLGLRLAGPRRRRLRGDDPRAQPRSATTGRCRSSGRTRAWTATGARRTRSRSCAGPTSRRPRSRSTRRSRRRR